MSALVAMVTLTGVPSSPPAVAAAGPPVLASAADDGEPGNFASKRPSLSADGTKVAFESDATNLHPSAVPASEGEDFTQVYVKDLDTGAVIVASTSDSGEVANAVSDLDDITQSLSDDGSNVLFRSEASNLIAGDPAIPHLYVKDLEAESGDQSLIRVNETSDGTILSDFDDATLSADGTAAAFVWWDDTTKTSYLFVKDLASGTLTTVDEVDATVGWFSGPSLSADGTVVAYQQDGDDDIQVWVTSLPDGEPQLASTATDDAAAANGFSENPRLSADGTKVAFSSEASNLHPGVPDDGSPRVYVKDLVTRELVLASSSRHGVVADQGGVGHALSGDGTYVAFWSHATNLHRLDPPHPFSNHPDLFVKDLRTGDITLAGRNEHGDSPDEELEQLALSSDGGLVAFSTEAENLHPDVHPDLLGGVWSQVYAETVHFEENNLPRLTQPVVWTTVGTPTSVTLEATDVEGDPLTYDVVAPPEHGSLDCVGANCTFTPAAGFVGADTFLVAVSDGWSEDWSQEEGIIQVLDAGGGDLTLASATADGVPANGNILDQALSANGTKVAFVSNATNLHAADTDSMYDVFIKDLINGSLELVSRVGTNGPKANGRSVDVALSADGTRVAFVSDATNLDSETTTAVQRLFVKDLQTGAIVVGANDGWEPALSADGTKLAFISQAGDLLAGVDAGVNQIYVKDLGSGTVTLASATADGEAADMHAESSFAFSADGTTVAFSTGATNLGPPTAAGTWNLYVKDVNGGSLVLASTSSAGDLANSHSDSPSLSSDGSTVAFQSQATNLHPSALPGAVYVKDLVTGSVTAGYVSEHEPVFNGQLDLSADGTRIAVAVGQQVIYTVDLADGTLTTTSASSVDRRADGQFLSPELSADGTRAMFTGTSMTIHPAITPDSWSTQVYVKTLPAAPSLPPVDDDGVDGTIEDGAPGGDGNGNGDGNGDGKLDSAQANVTSLPSATGNYVTLAAPEGVTLAAVSAIDPASLTTPAPPGYTLPDGLIQFTANGVTPGSTVTFSIYAASTDGVTGYAKFHDGNWTLLPQEQVTLDGNRVDITITDGGIGDDDDVANGTIVDPGGIVILASAPPPTETPAEAIAGLRATLQAMNIHAGITKALDTDLRAAYDAAVANNTKKACSALISFPKKVSAQAGKKLTHDQAATLTDAVTQIRVSLGCS